MINNLPKDILLNIKEYLLEKESNNFRIASKYYSIIIPMKFNINSLLYGLNKLKNGETTVHFINKETCSKVVNYVKKNYNFSHVCC